MKRQDYVFGSTTTNVEEQSASALNNGWAELSILYSRVLNGVCAALSQSTNIVSQEVANAIEGMGVELNDSDDSQLLSVLQTLAIKSSDFNTPVTSSNKGATMKEIEEIITTSLVFKGYVSTTEPTQNLIEGNLWINSATMPTNFPLAAASIKEWNGTEWVAYSSTYTPNNFDSFRNTNDNEGYYWFGGQWKVLSTDLSTDYFYLNQVSGKWEIKNNVNLPGTPTVDTPLATDTRAIANVDFVLNNSISSRNISNCIIKIPQDIKLELNNGTLTLKAGSKVYAPNGFETDGTTPKFDKITIENDITANTTFYDNTVPSVLYYDFDDNILYNSPTNAVASGSTQPSTSFTSYLWYDTANNKIKRYTVNTWHTGHSLPIAICSHDSNVWTSIDQIFNGFGYIGSTVFALPGVKGLIPDGRNADGSLKNITTNDFTTVKTVQVNTNTAKIAMYSGGGIGVQSKNFGLNEAENYNYDADGLKTALEVASVMVNSSRRITSFTPKTVFHAVDYNDFYASTAGSLMARILGAVYPAGSLYLTTYNTDTCPIAKLIPESTWELIGSGRALWTGNGSNGGSTIAAGLPNITGSVEIVGQGAWFETGLGSGALSTRGSAENIAAASSVGRAVREHGIAIDASKSSPIYGNSNTVQPPAFVVNVWRRTA